MQIAYRVWGVLGGDPSVDVRNFRLPKNVVYQEEPTEEQALAEANFVEQAFIAAASKGKRL